MDRVRKWLQSAVVAAVCAATLAAAPGHADPTIAGIDPPQAPVQGFVTILGSGFGDAQGTGYVTLGGHWIPVVAWSAGAIHVAVNPVVFNQSPLALNTPYPMQVVLPSGGHLSNTVNFTLIAGTPPPYPNVSDSPPSDQTAVVSFSGPLYCSGDAVAIHGSGFGDAQGSGYVTLDAPFLDAQQNLFTQEVQVPVLAWSENTVTIILSPPGGALPGEYTVTVHRGNGNTTSASFVVGSIVNGSCIAPVPAATLGPPSANFGSVAVGASATRSFTLTNPGPAPLKVINVTFNGAPQANFHFSGGDASGYLAPGTSRTITVAFSPSIGANTSYNASFSVIADGVVSPSFVTLTGAGTGGQPAVQLSPASVDFGSVTVESTATRSVTLTNSGTGPLNVANVTMESGSGDVNDFTPSAAEGPQVFLAPGASETITITFKPSGGQGRHAIVDVVTNASTSPNRIFVSGTGS